MRIIVGKIDNFSNNEAEIVIAMLGAGKIGVVPTDTIYGLSALAENKRAVAKIYEVKNRNSNKPLILLMKSLSMLRQYCYLNVHQYGYIQKKNYSTQPITFILKSKKVSLKHLTNDQGGLAVRIPRESKLLMKLLKKMNKPIVSTSLNLSGEPPILDLKDIDKKIDINGIDFIIDMGKIRKRKASRIVDITDIRNIKIIRK